MIQLTLLNYYCFRKEKYTWDLWQKINLLGLVSDITEYNNLSCQKLMIMF